MRRHIYRKPLLDNEDRFPPCFGHYSFQNWACRICLLSRQRKGIQNPTIERLRKEAEALALRHWHDPKFRQLLQDKFGITYLTPEGLKKFSCRYVICSYRRGIKLEGGV